MTNNAMNTASAPAHDDTPRLPLYLRGSVATQISGQSNAIIVKRSGHAANRYPLVRLSRIIANQRVEISASAIQCCMDARIPIVLIDADGQPTGYIQPPQSAPSRLDDRLRELMDHPDADALYQHWKRAQRMRLIHAWEEQQRHAGREITANEHHENVRRHLDSDGKVHIIAAWSLYEGALAAHVSQRLQQAGVSARYWGEDGKAFDLRSEIVEHLELALNLEISGLGKDLHGQTEALLRVLHSFGPTLTAHIDDFMKRLHKTLREQLEEWR